MTIPVIVDYDAKVGKPVSLRIVMLACNRSYRAVAASDGCAPQSFTFSDFTVS